MTAALWLQLFQVPAVSAVALVGARIANQQKEIAAEKVKLDKFDRRFKVFDAIRAFLAHVTMTADADNDHFREFERATFDTVFLFDEPMAEFVEQLRRRTIEMQSLRFRQDRNLEKDGQAAGEKWVALQDAFNVDLRSLPDRFRPFLGLTK
jgi:hypothetical protein